MSTGKPRRNSYTYHALAYQQRKMGPQLVLFHAPAAEIVVWAQIDSLGPTTRGPQRERQNAKVDGVERYLRSSEENTIPTAVVIAFPPKSATIESKNGVQRLTVGRSSRGSVVDGQHRVLGVNEFDATLELAVVGLLGTDEVEHAFQFLVINNKASRVAAKHTKALLAKMKNTELIPRLKRARLSFNTAGVRDVDLVNSDPESPFHNMVDWTITPEADRRIPATAIEQSLRYLEGLGLPELEDGDVRRSVFLAIWIKLKSMWPDPWNDESSHLLTKVGIFSMTRFVADLISAWGDREELELSLADLDDVKKETERIAAKMATEFWTAPWAATASGGFDTKQGRERVNIALRQLHRNGMRGIDWWTDIEIVEPPTSSFRVPS